MIDSKSNFPVIAAVESLRAEVDADKAQIESECRLPASIVQRLDDVGLLDLTIAKKLGGRETTALESIRAIEEMAYTDSAVAWCMMIYYTTAMSSGSLSDKWAERIYRVDGRSPVTAGAAAPTGKAKVVDGGLEITGRWAWGSGSHNADWIVGGTMVFDGDDMRRWPDGEPMVHVAYFEKSQVILHDNWDPIGLRGTGSVDFEVSKAFVPEGRWMLHGDPNINIHTALYRFPYYGYFAAAIAAVPLGVATRALDDFAGLIEKRVPAWQKKKAADAVATQEVLARAESIIEGTRRNLYHLISEIWQKAESGEEADIEDRRQLRLAACHATTSCTEAVDMLYNAAGGSAVHNDFSMQRHFRDVHTATQHMMVGPRMLQMAGAAKIFGDIPGLRAL